MASCITSQTKSGQTRLKWERGYRAPRTEDDVLDNIQAALAEKIPEWEARDLIPTERFPEDSNDDRPIQYGMPLWRDLFSPRQLLSATAPAWRCSGNCWRKSNSGARSPR